MNGAMRIALRVWHDGEMQDHIDKLFFTAFDTHTERFGRGTLPVHDTERIAASCGAFWLKPCV